MDGFQPGPMVVDSLPFEPGVINDALHDKFADGAPGEQPPNWPISATLRMPDNSTTSRSMVAST